MPVTVIAGRYELGAVLGTGGMGQVVAAHDLLLGRDVAMKLLTSTPDAAARARFLREAQGTARLHHPNAVTVFDTGEADGQPYLVMELVRGRTLKSLIDAQGPLEIEQAVAITVGVLTALGAAHRAGLVHRDVKPANVMIPDEGGVKLTDFGIAKAFDAAHVGLTATGTVLGTPAYIAPELLEGGPAGPASDLYSAGCLLYTQLTGRPPFTADTALALAYAHRHSPAPAVEHLRPEVPPELRAIVARALAKDPTDRYADADAMRDALVNGPDPAAASRSTSTRVLPVAAGGATAGAGPATATDATVQLEQPSRTTTPGSRPPWAIVVIGALLLLAFVGLSRILTSDDAPAPVDDAGDDEPTDEQTDEPTDEPVPDPEPPTDAGEDPTPEPDEPVDDAPEVPEPADDEPADDEPADDEPAESDADPGGPPGGDGPPGQEGRDDRDGPPGQSD